jgi:hypothetical protein
MSVHRGGRGLQSLRHQGIEAEQRNFAQMRRLQRQRGRTSSLDLLGHGHQMTPRLSRSKGTVNYGPTHPNLGGDGGKER